MWEPGGSHIVVYGYCFYRLINVVKDTISATFTVPSPLISASFSMNFPVEVDLPIRWFTISTMSVASTLPYRINHHGLSNGSATKDGCRVGGDAVAVVDTEAHKP